MQETSTSPARRAGIHVHRGMSSNDTGKDRGSTFEKIATHSSSPECRNSSGPQLPSSLEPIIEAPTGKFIKPRFWQLLIVFIVGVTHPRPHQQHSFCRSRSNSMDIDQPSVDRAVYYFADSFENIPRPEDHSFFKDQLRAIMIFKWMRFYCYHPKLSKGIDRPRRDELKDHLILPPGFGQRLGSFFISKFNSLKTDLSGMIRTVWLRPMRALPWVGLMQLSRTR